MAWHKAQKRKPKRRSNPYNPERRLRRGCSQELAGIKGKVAVAMKAAHAYTWRG